MKTFLKLALTALLAAASVQAQTATLARDVAAQEVPDNFRWFDDLHPLGQRLFFTSNDAAWATDGTSAGTRMLATPCSGSCSSREFLGTLGGRLVWLQGRLWSTDGTAAGTVPLTDPGVRIGGDTWETTGVQLGDRIYFRGCQEDPDSDTRCLIWRTDGTREGTAPIPELALDPEIDHVRDLVAASGRVYFVAGNSWGRQPDAIWSADAQGARPLVERPRAYREAWTAWGNLFFFTAFADDAEQLWVTDGTPEGTRSLGSFPGGLRNWLSTGPSGLYFVADDITHGEEIWRSDGTPEGTRRVTELGYYEPFYLFFFDRGPEGWAHEIGGRLLFAADDQIDGRRLWTTAGTPESTKAVGGAELSSRLYRAGDRLFAYRYDDQQQDCEIWSFDASGTGTRLVDRIAKEVCGPGTYWSNLRLETAGSRVYFSAQDGPSSWAVWRSDGTAKGTVKLHTSSTSLGWVEVASDESRVWFTSQQGLWLWDARDGARLVAGSEVRNLASFPSGLAAHQGRLFFAASDTGDYNERTVWSSQGSEEDTSMVLSHAGAGCSYPDRLVSTGAALLFVCDDSTFTDDELRRVDAGGSSTLLAEGVPDELVLLEHKGKVWYAQEGEVWTTDGTTGNPAGTARLTDAGGNPLLARHYSSTFPTPPWALSDGQLVYLLAWDPGFSTASVWRSDGKPAGTFPLVEGVYESAFAVARAGSTTLIRLGSELWRTDGTPAGTVRLVRPGGGRLLDSPYSLTAHGGAFYLYADHGSTRMSFWRTDGTADGTAALLPAFNWGPSYGYDDRELPRPDPVGLGAKLVFVAFDREHGMELWTTDGTPAGTSLLFDAAPGPASSTPAALVAAGGAVWFTAWDPVHGRELWRTDGTPAGTRLVHDIAPEGRSSSPRYLTEAGGRLYFSADDGITGHEIWSLPLAGGGACQPSDKALCLQGGRFRVETRWRDFQGNNGAGRAIPLTGDTGTFWFFSPSNVEVLLKVLDGRGVNDHFWVFYGALSSVEYSLTVTDTQTGLARRYSNPGGQLASSGDTEGFGPRGAQSTVPDVLTAAPSPPARVRGWSSTAATAPCAPGARRLCLNNGRFAVEVAWKDFQGNAGQGTAVPFSGDTGFFWFFDQANVELAVKVLDGTPLNGKHWVFYGALSSVEYTVTVTDTQTGSVKEYRNPAGQFGSVGDTGAF
jgi:ELWxxDGT repeat protein